MWEVLRVDTELEHAMTDMRRGGQTTVLNEREPVGSVSQTSRRIWGSFDVRHQMFVFRSQHEVGGQRRVDKSTSDLHTGQVDDGRKASNT